MNTKLIHKLVFISLISCLSFGCRANINSGHYVGTLSYIENRHFTQKPVSINFDLNDNYAAKIEVKDLHKNIIDTFQVHWDKWKDKIYINIPRINLDMVKLKRVALKIPGDLHWRCYQGNSYFTLSFCLSKQNFILNIYDTKTKDLTYFLSGDFSAEQDPLPHEEPRSYNLSEALAIVQNKSFEMQIEYQRLIQAKEGVRLAYFNLLPHINYKTILAGSALNLNGMLSFIADFIPFVIPTRWLKVMEAGEMKEAEKLTIDILKADLINQVANLSYIYTQDKIDYDFLQNLKERTSALVNHVREIKPSEPSPFDEIDFRLYGIENLIEQELVRVENSMKLDKAAIALSLGFYQSNAVVDLDIQEDPLSIENAKQLIEQDIAQASVERSLELTQLDHLIQNAHLQKHEYFFNWADPDISSSMSISFSLIPYAARSKAVINELLKKRKQVQSQVFQRSENAVTTYNLNIEKYKKLKIGEDWLYPHVNQMLNDILAAKGTQDLHSTGPNLQWALQTYIQTRLSIHATITKYRISRAQIQRALLERYYSRFQMKDTESLLSDG